jgi:hypothetical protein
MCAGTSRLRPDVTVETVSGDRWALEIFHTHESTPERNAKLEGMGYRVAEFKADAVIMSFGRVLDEGPVSPPNRLERKLCDACKSAEEARIEREAKEKSEREERELRLKLENEERKHKRSCENAKSMDLAGRALEERRAVRARNDQLGKFNCFFCRDVTRTPIWYESGVAGARGKRPFCAACCGQCPGCHEEIPLEQLAQWARCWSCNKEGR